jgi:hypothetical protein
VEWVGAGRKLPKCWGHEWKLPAGEVTFNPNARPETFFARDNVHNFITWSRKLGIFECLLFESDDLILRKNEKNVILCLLEVSFIIYVVRERMGNTWQEGTLIADID